MPVRYCVEAKFRNRTDGLFSGHAYPTRRRIVVSIQATEISRCYRFPWTDNGVSVGLKSAGIVRTMADRMEALVNVTAHELRHLQAVLETERTRRRSGYGSSERYTERDAQIVLATFRANREALLADWNRPATVKPAKQKLTRAERNEANARKLLKLWEAKLKYAQNKVKKYRASCRRYDRIAATTKHAR
jgi:hypothetical protein